MRYDYPSMAPTLIADLRRVTAQLHAGPVGRSILALVELRVSQINGCAFCIDRHAREAHQAGVTLGMIIGLSAWRDDRRYADTLRAALALAEALTDPVHRSERDAAYDALDSLVSQAEIVHLTMAIGLAGAWNRIASGCRRDVGDAPWPHDGGHQASRAAASQTQPFTKVTSETETHQHQAASEWIEYRSLLSAAPRIVSSLVRAIPDDLWRITGASDRWTIQQIIGHLVHVETEGWLPRIRQINDQAEPVLQRVDAHLHVDRFAALPMEELLTRFSELRQDNLQQMDALHLDSDNLARTGVHPDQGFVQLRHLIATWCMHDLSHLDQIVRNIASAYTERVGPLAAYLRLCRRES